MDVDLSEATLERLLASDPEQARRRAIDAARSAVGPTRTSLLAVAAEASVRVGAIADACSLFESAVLAATEDGDARLGGLRVRHAAMVAASGDSAAALLELDAAEAVLGDEAWRAWLQRGLVLHWMGRSQEALQWLEASDPLVRSAGDALTIAKLTMNRALAYAHVGDYEAATIDAAEAERVCLSIDEPTLAAHARHNRGWIAARAGDLAEGWRLMHDAAADGAWVAPPVAMADRAELSEAAGLLAEANDWADAAWSAQREVGDEHGAAGTLVLRARIALGLGQLDRAEALASESIDELSSQGRTMLAAAGASVRIEAARDRLQRGVSELDQSAILQRLTTDIERVQAHPWHTVRVDGLIAAGEAYVALTQMDEARKLFDAVPRRGPGAHTDVRSYVAHALGVGSGPPATDALESAWKLLDDRRRAPISEELRGEWGAETRLLTRAALVPALRRGDADTAIRWLERLRSPALGTSSADTELTAIARALRAVTDRKRRMADDVEAQGLVDLDIEAADLEQRLVDRSRLIGTPVDRENEPMSAGELAARLGDRTLVWVVALPSGTWRVRLSAESADVSTVHDDVALGDLSSLRRDVALGRPGWQDLAADADRSLRTHDWGARPVVIAVGSPVEDIPWATLPELRGRPLRMCWSGGHFVRTDHARDTSVVTVIAGGVDGADREADLLHSVWPGAAVIAGDDATASRVGNAIATSTLVHVAAHGHLRRDNPMLSSVECVDGPLYGYELARLDRAASTIVLWSCGLGGARMPGDVGALGWSTLLEARGANALIASAAPFPSEPAPDLAYDLHRGLADGTDSGALLAELRTHAVGDEPRLRSATMLAVHGAG